MKDWYYRRLKYISESYDLIVDTREQITPRYKARIESFKRMGVTPVRRKLFAGDYSAIAHTPAGDLDFTCRIALERKMSLEELITCLSSDYERFKAELERAYESGCKLYVVIEGGSYADLAAGNYRNKFTPKKALATYHTLEQRYNCHFVFVPPGAFPIFVHETLRRYIMDYLCKKYPNGKIL